jgi:hypothetical protein
MPPENRHLMGYAAAVDMSGVRQRARQWTDFARARVAGSDPFFPVAGLAAVATVAVALHRGGVSTHETIIACLVAAAIALVLMPTVFAVTDRLLPPRESMTWWQWWKAINFVPKVIGNAVIFLVVSGWAFASGDWDWGAGFAAAAACSGFCGAVYLRRLQRRTGNR